MKFLLTQGTENFPGFKKV